MQREIPPVKEITLRDVFALAALAGMSHLITLKGRERLAGGELEGELTAQASYRLADAMLAERSKGKS